MERENASAVDKLLSAVLYEGYLLFPYRVSAPKNRKRFTFGRVYPKAFGAAPDGAEPATMQTEFLLHYPPPVPPKQGEPLRLGFTARFLHPLWREVLMEGAVVDQVEAGGLLLQTSQEAVEREVRLEQICLHNNDNEVASRTEQFQFPGAESTLPVPDLARAIAIRRRQEPISGSLACQATKLSRELWKVSVQVTNTSPFPASSQEEVLLMRTFVSTHTIACLSGTGRFLSLLDPPPEFTGAAAQCQNRGLWPVLIGEEGQADCMLAAPIILYDYPRVAPESSMNHFDGTEIDELLALQVLALADSEKIQARHSDERAAKILDYVETLRPEEFLRMHGAIRETTPPKHPTSNEATGDSHTGSHFLQPGDHVRIRPAPGADALDSLLAGRRAVIESVEEDVDGRVYFALVLEDDPGKDFGFQRMPGHRFFYLSEEVEPADL
jgi:hydrogenase maturation protease